MKTTMNTINKADNIFVMLILVALVRTTMAEYNITPVALPMPPAPNACKILSMSMAFSPEVVSTVVLSLSVQTNVLVQAFCTVTNMVEVVLTNEANEISVTTNAVPEVIETNVFHATTLYEYAPIPIRMSQEETMQMAVLTVAQFGLSATNTISEVIDALIRAGMQAQGYEITGGTLPDMR